MRPRRKIAEPPATESGELNETRTKRARLVDDPRGEPNAAVGTADVCRIRCPSGGAERYRGFRKPSAANRFTGPPV